MSETMRLDFTGVEGQTAFEPLPAGRYTLEVEDFKMGTASENAKNPGATTISWTLSVIDDEKYEGRKIWENMTLVPNSLWRLKAFLECAGFDVSEGEMEFNPEEVINSVVEAKIGIQKGRKNPATGEEYDPRNVIKQFFPGKKSEAPY